MLLLLGTHCRDIPVAPKSSHFNAKATKASFAHMDIYDGFIIFFFKLMLIDLTFVTYIL